MNYTGYIFLFTLLINTLHAFPQKELTIRKNPESIVFEHIDPSHGLSTRATRCIFQDSYGFIWVGTQYGLNRFDGYSMNVFLNDNPDTSSLSYDRIWSVYEDNEKNLWICTRRGLSRFNRANNTFVSFYPNVNKPNSPDNIIYSIRQDSRGDYWTFTDAGLYLFDASNKQFNDFKEDSIHARHIWEKGIICWHKFRFYEDSKGIIWIGSHQGLKKYDPKKGYFETFKYEEDNPQSLSHNFVTGVAEDSGHNLWVATNGGGLNLMTNKETGIFKHYLHDENNDSSVISDELLHPFTDRNGHMWISGLNGFSRYLPDKDCFKSYRLPGEKDDETNAIINIIEDNKGNFWLIPISKGLYYYNKVKDEIYTFHNDPKNSLSINNNEVSDLIVDKTNSVWISTYGGVEKIDMAAKSFKTVSNNPDNSNSLSGDVATAFYKDTNGVLWVGTMYNGLNLVIYDSVRHEKMYFHYRQAPDKENTISHNYVTTFYKDSSDIMWVGTAYGLNRLNLKGVDFSGNTRPKLLFERIYGSTDEDNTLTGNFIEVIYKDTKENFWVGTSNGLNLILPDGTIKTFMSEADSQGTLPDNLVDAILEDSEGTLWFGTYYGGLCKYHPETSAFSVYQSEPGNPNTLSDNCARHILEDRYGRLWIASLKGLNLFDRETGTFKLFGKRDGLNGEFIKGMLEDSKGNLWISTNRGLSKFILENGDSSIRNPVFRNYDVSDGIQGYEFNRKSCYKAPNGDMYFGGLNGYNVFNPDSIRDNTYIPPVYITSFSKMHRPVYFNKPACELEEIVLQYNEDVFSFEFIGLNYSNPSKNRYAYRLDGFDESWIHCGNKREAVYTSIPPGKYTFRAKASNNDGIWNHDGVKVDVIIKPPFWATWWFRGFVFALIVIAIFVVVRLREQSLRKKKRLLEEKVRIRTARIQAQKIEIEEQRNKLHELNATKDKFFEIIAHDMKNSFTSILSITDAISTSFSELDDTDKIEVFKRVRNSTGHLNSLMNNLLNWARSQTGKIEFLPEKINLHETIQAVMHLHNPVAQEKNITFKLQDNSSSTILADKHMIDTVLRNLVSNAFKFTGENGNIDITVNENGEHVEVSVSDTGPGLSEEDIKKLFRIDVKTKSIGESKQGKGTGLGLILCKEFVESHGGTIYAKSRVGEGTCFTFTLPKAEG